MATSLRRNHFITCTNGIFGLYKNCKTKFKQLLRKAQKGYAAQGSDPALGRAGYNDVEQGSQGW
jgi:hypothetical protein